MKTMPYKECSLGLPDMHRSWATLSKQHLVPKLLIGHAWLKATVLDSTTVTAMVLDQFSNLYKEMTEKNANC